MDFTKYKEDYHNLSAFSENGADIYSSAYYQKMLEEAGHTSCDLSMEAITRMQLAQEQFSHLEIKKDLPKDPDQLEARKKHDIHQILCGQLEPYTGRERHGILLGLLEQTSQLLERPMTEYNRLLLSRQSIEELEYHVADAIQQLGNQLLSKGIISAANIPEDRTEGYLTKSSAAAAAAAAYLDVPELRDMPELIGATSSAAVNIAEIHVSDDLSDNMLETEYIAYYLLFFTWYVICFVLLLSYFGLPTAIAAETNLVVGISMSVLEIVGMSVMALLPTIVLVTAGLGIAVLIAEGISVLENWGNSSLEQPSKALASNSDNTQASHIDFCENMDIEDEEDEDEDRDAENSS